ncbi:MAG: hypothetical protein M3167_06055 [Acidobacteriota bacterium]|nr:hypothetical protein [Acidobacteriota bacterium]
MTPEEEARRDAAIEKAAKEAREFLEKNPELPEAVDVVECEQCGAFMAIGPGEDPDEVAGRVLHKQGCPLMKPRG